jgi:NDP-sugar pyrophosphorylase family protein
MKAMIFAAGLGTRLGNITRNIPKALVEINGKTILHTAVEKCSFHGFNDIIINVHHFADMVEAEVFRLNRMGFTVSVSDERESLLDTGGGLYKARSFFDTEPFLIYNVDIVTDLDLSELYRFHKANKGLATFAVRNRPGTRLLIVDENGLLNGWCNTTTGEEIITRNKISRLNRIAFSGIHIVEPLIFRYMNEGAYSLMPLYIRLSADHNILTFRHDGGHWFDIRTPEILEQTRKYFGSS